MTNPQKEQISFLRYAGKGYKAIAQALSMKETTVKTYCFRNGLTDKDLTASEKAKSICPYCGERIEQRPKQKPRRFCSDKCRYAWWNKNQDIRKHSATYKHICEFCRKEFVSYGSQSRKYCSHQCYVAARYGKESVSLDGKAAKK